MSDNPCGHDKRFGGVFDMPKEDRGCIACGFERLQSELAAWQRTAALTQNEERSLRRELADAQRDAARFVWWFDPNNDAAEFMTLPIHEGSVDDWRRAIDAAMQEGER